MLNSNMSDLPVCKQTTRVCETVGDGNCFFHAVFGDYTPDGYRAERAQDMRMEWHRFLNQFTCLNDESMPADLKSQLYSVLTTFLGEPEKLGSNSHKIKDFAKEVNDKVDKASNDIRELREAIAAKFREDDEFAKIIYSVITDVYNTRSLGNKKVSLTISDLRKEENKNKLLAPIEEDTFPYLSCYIPGLHIRDYDVRYNPKFISDTFIESESLYQAYLEEIQSQSYFIFIEEVPILASLSNTRIIVNIEGNSEQNVHDFKPDSRMINTKYVRVDKLWGSKEQETIFLSAGHFSRLVLGPEQIAGDLAGPSCAKQGSSTDISSSKNETQKQSSILKGPPVTKNQKKAGPASGICLLSKDFQENLTGNNCRSFLENYVISDLGKHIYKWTESNDIIFGVEGCEILRAQLNKFKKNRDKKLIYILNQNSNHWVTLVAIRDNRKEDIFFYSDSLGEGIETCLVSATGRCNVGRNMKNKASSVKRTCLDEFLESNGYSKNNIYNVSCKQQQDGHNCGVFALENAKEILNVIGGGNYDHVKVKESLKSLKKDPVSLRKGFAEGLKETLNSESTVAKKSERSVNKPKKACKLKYDHVKVKESLKSLKKDPVSLRKGFAEGLKETLNSESTVAKKSERSVNKPKKACKLKSGVITKNASGNDDSFFCFLRTKEEKAMFDFLSKNQYISGIQSIIRGSGCKSEEAFKAAYNTFFDSNGKKTDELQHVLGIGFTMDHVFSIMTNSGVRVGKLFNEFHNAVCTKEGEKTPELEHILSTGLTLCDVKNIMRGVRGKAAEMFRKFYDVFFFEGKPKAILIRLSASVMSMQDLVTILGMRGIVHVEVLEKLINKFFDSEGKAKQELEHMLNARCTMHDISYILSGSGRHTLKVFNDLHNIWFDKEGRKKKELSCMLNFGFDWKSISRALGKSGDKSPEMFNQLHSIFFSKDGSEKLRLMLDNGLTVSHILSIVNKSKLNFSKAFDSFYKVLFDEKKERTKEFNDYLEYGFTLTRIFNVISISSAKIADVFKDFHDALFFIVNQESRISYISRRCLNSEKVSSLMIGAGSKAPGAFEKLYDALFDNRGQPSSELQDILRAGLSLTVVFSILSGSGAQVAETFKKLHGILFKSDGEKTNELNHMIDSGIYLPGIASVLHGSGSKAPKAFKNLHDVLFKSDGGKTDELSHIIDSGIHFSSITSILSGSGAKAAEAFKNLHDVLFESDGQQTDELSRMLNCGVRFFCISNVLSGAGLKAAEAFKNLHDTLFDKEGKATNILSSITNSGLKLSFVFSLITKAKAAAADELKNLHKIFFDNKSEKIQNMLSGDIDFANVSSILSGSGTKASETFKNLYDILFKSDGEKTDKLNHIIDSGIDFANLSSILSGSGVKAPKAFNDLYGVLFDLDDNQQCRLDYILRSGIRFSSISGILCGSGAKAAEAFKNLYDVLFDGSGRKKTELEHMLNESIDFVNVSNILSRSGAKAAEAFKKLHDVLFESNGNQKSRLKCILNSEINFSSISHILSGSGTKAAEAFKNLYDVLFDGSGRKKTELENMLNKGISFVNVSNILNGSGTKAAEAFRNLYGVLFKSDGRKTDELIDMTDRGIDFASLSNIISSAGAGIGEVFYELYYAFDLKGKETGKLSRILDIGIDFVSISTIMARLGPRAPEVFNRLYDALFSLDKSQRCKIEYMLKRKVNFSSISCILKRTGVEAPKAFNGLYDALFDLDHNQRCKLDYILQSRVSFSSISSILKNAGERAPKAFNGLYDALFDFNGRETDKLTNVLSSGIAFSSISGILCGSGIKAPEAFKNLYSVLFDSSGNQKSRLECILNSRVDFSSISHILTETGANAPEAFKNLYDVLFDSSGRERPELERILNIGINFSSLSHIIGVGANAPEAFKNLYDVLFDSSGRERPELERILNIGVDFTNVSSILSGSGTKAAEAFKKLCNVLFDLDDNQLCKLDYILQSGIAFSSISSILSGSGTKAAEAFKDFYDALFDEEGGKTDELSHIIDSDIDFASLSSILSGAGLKAAEAFKNLYGVLFKSDGGKTDELSHIIDSGIGFANVFSILRRSGTKAAEAFKNLYGVLFKSDGGKTDELSHIIDSGIDFASLSSILSGSGAKAAEAFKKLYDVLFDSSGNQKCIFDQELNVTHFFNILACSGEKAPEILKDFYDAFSDNKVDLEADLQCMLSNQMAPDNISDILYGSGLNAKSCFKDLRYALFDSNGAVVQDLDDMLKNEITICDLSNILSKTGIKAPEVFKRFYHVLFDDKRKPKRELKDMLFHKISLGDIFNILGEEGEVSPEAFRKLHGVLFKSDGRKTDELSHIIDSGIDFASVSSILSGSGAKAAEAFKDFYDALFDKEGGKKPNLERILNEKISFVEISRVLYGTGAKAKERFNQLCGFWFDFEGEEVSDVYIASIFNLKVLKNNSVFGLPENIAQICVCLSTWSSEMLMGKNVQSLSDKLIKNVKKISAQFKFQDIAPIYNAITKLYESKQRSASFSHANFDNSIYNDCVSDLAARAIAIAPVKHNIRYIMNTVFSLSRLTHAGLVIDEDLLCELIRSLTKGLGDCRLDSSYSDENYLCIRVLVNSLCTLVYLIYQNGERDAIINKELAQGMLRMVSNLNSLQKDVKSSTEILSILGRVSKLTKDKVEIKFFQRTIGRVLYRLHFIGEHRNDDLEKKALSVVHELSDELKNLLHSDWYLDYLLGKTRVEGHLKRTKGESPITSDNILIDEDQPEKYTLKQIKEQGKIKYKAGIEDQIKYNYRALGLNSDFNVEKNDSSIILAKIACLEEETVYGLFLNTQERISPKAFLGTGNREMNECTLERYSQISTNSEKERNWVSYLNHASIGTSNVVATLNRIQRHACFILSTSREILPGHQLLFNYKQDCSRKLDSTPIYLHYTDNYKSPSQRYNSAKDFYYDYVFSLEKEIARGLGYRGQKYFVVTKLFKEIYDNSLSQAGCAPDTIAALSEGSNMPIYAVTLKNKKWNFDKYSEQQQIVPLMLACYLGQEDIIKVLLERDYVDVTRRSLHDGYNALTFTVISRRTDSETKKRILGRLIEKISTIDKMHDNAKQVVMFVSEVLCSTDSLGYNLFDHLMSAGEYLLYQEFYKKLSPQSQRKVARKFIIERGIFNVVFSLGDLEYIKIVNLLLKKVSVKMIKECLENHEKRGVDCNEELADLLSNNRDMRLSNFGKLTSLSEPIKRKIFSFLVGEEPPQEGVSPNVAGELPQEGARPTRKRACPNVAGEPPQEGVGSSIAGEELLQEGACPNVAGEPPQEGVGSNIAGEELPQEGARTSKEGEVDLLVNLANWDADINEYYKISDKCKGKIFKSLVDQKDSNYVNFNIDFIKKTIRTIRLSKSSLSPCNKEKLLKCFLWDVLRFNHKNELKNELKEVFSLALDLGCDVKKILSDLSYHSVRCAIYSGNIYFVEFILNKIGQDFDKEKMKDAILYATLLAVLNGDLKILLFLLNNVKEGEKMYFLSEIIKTTIYLHSKTYMYEELDSTEVFCHFANIITYDDREAIFKSVNASYKVNLELLKEKLVVSSVREDASISTEEPLQEGACPNVAGEPPQEGVGSSIAGEELLQEGACPNVAGEPPQEGASPNVAGEKPPRKGEVRLRECSTFEQKLRKLQAFPRDSLPPSSALDDLSLRKIKRRESDILM
ncbi:SET domain-containing protein-lysine N-methyltransferase [Wolbachia endosymbiont (group A) of Schoenobius gigantella]|uniref:SET domain-containing protein-lysine N-methyltransferase n=2 Tax=unclassified Wolbachia TaxID=2640676 RepID=UPI003CCB6F97